MTATVEQTLTSGTPPTPVDVSLVCVDLDGVDERMSNLVLSPEERERAGRFRFDIHRQRFIAAHATLRSVLARELDADPSALQFESGPYGKPFLSGVHQGRRSFNLSHADHYVLVATTETAKIGVDLERIRPVADFERLAEHVFAPIELAELRSLPANEQVAGFYRGWTRKEAYIKATGLGLQQPLADFAVSLTGAPRLSWVKDRPFESARWSLLVPDAVEGYVAALCVEAVDGAAGPGSETQ